MHFHRRFSICSTTSLSSKTTFYRALFQTMLHAFMTMDTKISLTFNSMEISSFFYPLTIMFSCDYLYVPLFIKPKASVTRCQTARRLYIARYLMYILGLCTLLKFERDKIR